MITIQYLAYTICAWKVFIFTSMDDIHVSTKSFILCKCKNMFNKTYFFIHSISNKNEKKIFGKMVFLRSCSIATEVNTLKNF